MNMVLDKPHIIIYRSVAIMLANLINILRTADLEWTNIDVDFTLAH